MTDRIYYIDLLRIFAALGVIFLHVSGQNYYAVSLDTEEFFAFNFFDGASRFSVPVFVMISGALFLSSAKGLKQIFCKKIVRLITAFLIWSLVYAFFTKSNAPFVSRLISGHFHLWYLCMLSGLYAITPLLKNAVEGRRRQIYFLALWLVFAVFFPEFFNIFQESSTVKAINDTVRNASLEFVLGYSGYFVLGFYLQSFEIDIKKEIIIYLLGAAGFFITVKFSKFGYFSPGVVLQSTSIFVFFKKRLNLKSKPFSKLVFTLSKLSFGVYLSHPLIIEKLNDVFGFNSLSLNPYLSVPVLALTVAVISFSLSAILNLIPGIKKFAV